jgi:hypothetical protein
MISAIGDATVSMKPPASCCPYHIEAIGNTGAITLASSPPSQSSMRDADRSDNIVVLIKEQRDAEMKSKREKFTWNSHLLNAIGALCSG